MPLRIQEDAPPTPFYLNSNIIIEYEVLNMGRPTGTFAPVTAPPMQIPNLSASSDYQFRVENITYDAPISDPDTAGAVVTIYICVPSPRPSIAAIAQPANPMNVGNPGGIIRPGARRNSDPSNPLWTAPSVASDTHFCVLAVTSATTPHALSMPPYNPAAPSVGSDNPADFDEVAQKNIIVVLGGGDFDDTINPDPPAVPSLPGGHSWWGTGFHIGNLTKKDGRVPLRVQRVSKLRTEHILRALDFSRNSKEWEHAPELGFEVVPVHTSVHQKVYVPEGFGVSHDGLVTKVAPQETKVKGAPDVVAQRSKPILTDVRRDGRVDLPELDFRTPWWASRKVGLKGVRSATRGTIFREYGVEGRTQRPMILATQALTVDEIMKRGGKRQVALFLIEELNERGAVVGGIGYVKYFDPPRDARYNRSWKKPR